MRGAMGKGKAKTGQTPGNRLATGNFRGELGSWGLAVALAFGRRLLARPAAGAYLSGLADRCFAPGGAPAPPPPQAGALADGVESLLRRTGPFPGRIGVDGLPGSGKSSLAAALGERLCLDVVCLDHTNLDKPRDLHRPFAIHEHHRLLRTQDIAPLDAIIYIDDPVEAAMARVLTRKRGAYLLEILDFTLHKRIGDLAFALADGLPLTVPGSAVRLKRRPADGYRHRQRIDDAVAERGGDAAGRSLEEALFLLAGLAPRHGFTAYLNAQALTADLFGALADCLPGSVLGRRGR